MEPSGYEDLPPRRRSGCLWGCLGVALIVILGFAGVFGYSTWYLYRGFENDTRLQTIMAIVRQDNEAEAILGHDIRIMEIESRSFGMATGLGKKATYTLRLSGSNGEGELDVDLDLGGEQAKVTLMILTGPDGHPHTLVGEYPANPMQTIWNLPERHLA